MRENAARVLDCINTESACADDHPFGTTPERERSTVQLLYHRPSDWLTVILAFDDDDIIATTHHKIATSIAHATTRSHGISKTPKYLTNCVLKRKAIKCANVVGDWSHRSGKYHALPMQAEAVTYKGRDRSLTSRAPISR
jgi:hypothetical protein